MWSGRSTEIDAAALGSKFATPVGMSPTGDTGQCSVSAMGHHASCRSLHASPVDKLIYAPAGCTNDEVCDIVAVHEHNEEVYSPRRQQTIITMAINEREPSYFVIEAAFTALVQSGSKVSQRSGKTKDETSCPRWREA